MTNLLAYDIFFRAARWNGETKAAPAQITVVHNGVVIHDHYAIKNKTGAGKKEAAAPGEILFQNHRDPVRFRNIWISTQGLNDPNYAQVAPTGGPVSAMGEEILYYPAPMRVRGVRRLFCR